MKEILEETKEDSQVPSLDKWVVVDQGCHVQVVDSWRAGIMQKEEKIQGGRVFLLW